MKKATGTRGWGRIPQGPIFAGALRDMTAAEAKLISAIAVHVDENYEACVSMERLAWQIGCTVRWTRASGRALEAKGKLRIKLGGGKGLANEYKLFPGAIATAPTGTPKSTPKSAKRPPRRTSTKGADASTERLTDEERQKRRKDRLQQTYTDAVECAMPDQEQAITKRWPGGFPDFLHAVGDEAAGQLLEHTKSEMRNTYSTNKSPAAVAAELAALARRGDEHD